MARLAQTFVLLFALALGTSAVAGEPGGDSPTTEPSEKEVRYKARTNIDFGERKVDGSVRGPVGVYTESLADKNWNPLIRLKMNFEPEISASVAQVR